MIFDNILSRLYEFVQKKINVIETYQKGWHGLQTLFFSLFSDTELLTLCLIAKLGGPCLTDPFINKCHFFFQTAAAQYEVCLFKLESDLVVPDSDAHVRMARSLTQLN